MVGPFVQLRYGLFFLYFYCRQYDIVHLDQIAPLQSQSKLRLVFDEGFPVFFPHEVSLNFGGCLIDVQTSSVEGAFESTYHSRFFEPHYIFFLFVYFKSDHVMAFANKNYLIHLLQFAKYFLVLLDKDWVEILQKLEDEVGIALVFIVIKTMLNLRVPFLKSKHLMENADELVKEKIGDYHPGNADR